jgi:hypothetical protein
MAGIKVESQLIGLFKQLAELQIQRDALLMAEIEVQAGRARIGGSGQIEPVNPSRQRIKGRSRRPSARSPETVGTIDASQAALVGPLENSVSEEVRGSRSGNSSEIDQLEPTMEKSDNSSHSLGFGWTAELNRDDDTAAPLSACRSFLLQSRSMG